MKKVILSITFFLACYSYANDNELTLEEKEYLKKIDSINLNFNYKKGVVQLDNLAELNLPEGFTFLEKEEAKYILEDLWGNPPSEVIGLMFPKGVTATNTNTSYAVEITYSKEGYVSDKDAKDIDYDDLLTQMQKDTKDGNQERTKQGYPTIDLIGWASSPYYDETEKKLHWAKELKFEGYDTHTLNYNIRILGRKGYLNLNVISDMDGLSEVNTDIPKILKSVSFKKGNQYKDFDPDVDKIAAYGIGGLIAGKLLAKAGIFALVLKFWKIIAIAIAGFFSAFKKKIFGNKEE